MIEKLKNKKYVRAFGLMKPEEQECFKKAGKVNCSHYNGDEWDPVCLGLFNRNSTYAIKPDYKPEPEYKDIEITQQGNWLGITRPWAWDYSRFPFDFTHLHCLPSLPNFEGFYLTSGDKQTEVRPEWVSRHFPNVIARFRTGGGH